MTRDSSNQANHMLQDRFHRCSLIYYNKRLDDVEEEIINVMKINDCRAWELVHDLIGERENIRYTLKELHKKIYG